MSNSLKTVIQFPITPISSSYANSLHANLCRSILTPRLSEVEQLWLEHTTEYATQYDVVCYLFETLEDANYDADDFCNEITQIVDKFIADNGEDALAELI